MPIAKAAAPSLPPVSEAKPASNSACTCTTGISGRRASTTGTPLDSVKRSRSGKARSGKASTLGTPVLRSTALCAVFCSCPNGSTVSV